MLLKTLVTSHFPRPIDGQKSLDEVMELKNLKVKEGPRRRVSVTRQKSSDKKENKDDPSSSIQATSTTVDDALAKENSEAERGESESEALVHGTGHKQQQTALRQRAENMLKRTRCLNQNKNFHVGLSLQWFLLPCSSSSLVSGAPKLHQTLSLMTLAAKLPQPDQCSSAEVQKNPPDQ